MSLKKSLTGLCALCVAFAAFGASMSKSVPKGWGEDFAKAKAEAEKDGRLILLAFSGSDWCGWCVKMEKEVYSDKKFIREAKDRFVLLMIDAPKNQSILSPLARAQNPGLLAQYGVRGFPCAVVVRPSGEEVKRFSGYQSGGPDAFLKALVEVADDAGGRSVKKAAAQRPAGRLKKNP